LPPRVDFYVSDEAGEVARLRLACRIAEKAYLAQQKVLCYADAALLPRFDELLWTFGDGSFVPHDTITREGTACDAPVALTSGPLPADPFIAPEASVLINLADTVPPFFERFARVAEFLDGRPEVRSAGRERFKAYRGRAIDPQTHNVG
jgi:DNA polymerase III subunit chi